MASANGALNVGLKTHQLLEPLPPLQLVPSVEKLDAGLRSLDHYRTRLPLWRYSLRQKLIPVVRWETPYLANIQKRVRSPALDTYFSVTANLGTHTFFMIFLPILFWCGQTSTARGMVTILALGVFFSGVIKDMWCLPRPLSPPLHRISMSHSTVLEYGFPSTHATNAMSVAVYVLFLLSAHSDSIKPTFRLSLQVFTCCYVTSIVLGRLYCGMHGFFDVIIGGGLGALISALQFQYGTLLDALIYSGSIKTLFLAILIVLLLVRIHPEPADDCPCFDDSVAFAGVVIGMSIATWHFAQTSIAWNKHGLAAVPFDYNSLGFARVLMRIILGTTLIVAWREVMKPALLRTLPPIFRVVEQLGLSHARRFFLQASDYNQVPGQLKDDNVIPSVSEIPSILTSFRHPRKSRSISIGPQSAADAYETLAYRERKRRESKSENSDTGGKPGLVSSASSSGALDRPSLGFGLASKLPHPDLGHSMISPETALYTPNTSRQPSQERRRDEKEEREMFSRLEKPRVRYDVEVVSKLIVYTGIAWIAIEGCPLLFEVVGLGGLDYHPG